MSLPAGGLDQLLGRAVLEPARRVYVNRNLRMENIRLVGFDMDYTLLPYTKQSIEQLSFTLTARKLVEKHGYPEEILSIEYDPEFVVRGLVVDKERGNIFKMNTHGHVGRVYHGRRMLSKEERKELYQRQKINVDSPRYHWIDTLFALPEGVLFAGVVDHFEARGEPLDYWRTFDLIRKSIDECHRDESLKSVVKAAPERFIQTDPELPLALHKLRSSGKRLVVLTNSLWDYTNRMMSFLLDGRLPEYPSWLNYFDLVLVGADKPSFFTQPREFFQVDKRTGLVSTTPATRFERQQVYQGGSLTRLDALLGVSGEQVLYVGDHIYGDIIRSKKDTLWRTALILSELEDEIRRRGELSEPAAELAKIEERASVLEDEVTELRLKIMALEGAFEAARASGDGDELARTRRQLRLSFDQRRRALKELGARRSALEGTIDRSYNRYWGSVFKEGTENSRFGRQVEYYACVYTSRVSNFLFYSPQQYYRSPRHWMPHEKT